MFKFRYFLICALFVFSLTSHAAYYEWSGGWGNDGYTYFSSPTAACTFALTSSGMLAFSYFENRGDPKRFLCFGSKEFPGESKPRENIFYHETLRRGSGCPDGTQYNSETGECKAPVPEPEPEPECNAGSTISKLFPVNKVGDFYVSTAPGFVCSSSCMYEQVTMGGGGCATYASGRFCTAHFAATGGSCGSDTATPDLPPLEDDKKCDRIEQTDGSYVWNCNPPPEQAHCPDGWLVGADGSTCYRDPSKPDPEEGGGSSGGGNSGETGGGNTGGNGDGDGDGNEGGGNSGGGSSGGGNSGETGGGNTGGNGDGNEGGGNSGGGSSGGGNSGGNGDGNGGAGDGEKGEDGEEGTGTGDDVEACEGERCGFGDERGDPFDGEVRSFADSMTAFYEGISSSPISSSINNIRFPTGGTCPVGSTSIDFGFGSFNIEFSEHCNLWQQISPIISAAFLALWALVSVRVFLSA